MYVIDSTHTKALTPTHSHIQTLKHSNSQTHTRAHAHTHTHIHTQDEDVLEQFFHHVVAVRVRACAVLVLEGHGELQVQQLAIPARVIVTGQDHRVSQRTRDGVSDGKDTRECQEGALLLLL